MRQTRFLSHANKIGVFASSLLLTVVSIYLYSPILGSHAGDGVTTRFEAVINPVASITLDISDLVFDIAPTASGTFSSSPITATVSTNSLGGYELYFSSDDDETDMVHDNAEISDVIASDFSGTVTSETMGANKWGYSLDNVDFSKIPTATNQLELRNIDHYPEAAEKTNTIYIGTKISTALTSGLYSKDVKFTAVAHDMPTPVGIHSITNMQDMTSAICAETTTPNTDATQFDWDGSHYDDKTYVPRVKLTDTRDNKTYLVSKLADGNCWMSQSLALDLTANTAIVASNNDGTTKTVTPNNTTQTTTGTTWAQADNNWRSYKPQTAESYYQAGITKASSASGTGDAYDWEKAGNYYNWYAATAGTGTSSMASAEAGSSICPKGWRLPSNTGNKSYYNLVTTAYGLASSAAGSTALRVDPLNFNLSGGYHYSSAAMSYQGSSGHYWSSSAYSTATNAYYLHFNASVIRPQYGSNKGLGFSVRCVAI